MGVCLRGQGDWGGGEDDRASGGEGGWHSGTLPFIGWHGGSNWLQGAGPVPDWGGRLAQGPSGSQRNLKPPPSLVCLPAMRAKDATITRMMGDVEWHKDRLGPHCSETPFMGDSLSAVLGWRQSKETTVGFSIVGADEVRSVGRWTPCLQSWGGVSLRRQRWDFQLLVQTKSERWGGGTLGVTNSVSMWRHKLCVSSDTSGRRELQIISSS
jgi:hypothetical protein